jgi:LmbE family N-acetylglucosaminyl deacetylase
METLKLLSVLAHPDDESLGNGGMLAKYAAEGVETYLLTATRGERGWFGAPEDNPGLAALGRIREAELRAAAAVLGVREVALLDYIDGDLDQADPVAAVAGIAAHIRRLRPQVVTTFDPTGAYGHPDHIAICQFTTAATIAAADPTYAPDAVSPPHRVLKLYYMSHPRDAYELYESVFGDLVMTVDGVERRGAPWHDWAITTRLDTGAYWRQVWQAIACHRSQLPGYEDILRLPEAQLQTLFGRQSYYRAYSLVNGGRGLETDLFAGIRAPE